MCIYIIYIHIGKKRESGRYLRIPVSELHWMVSGMVCSIVNREMRYILAGRGILPQPYIIYNLI